MIGNPRRAMRVSSQGFFCNRSQGCRVRCASNHLIVSVYRVPQMQGVGRADVLLYFKCPTTKQMRCPVNAYLFLSCFTSNRLLKNVTSAAKARQRQPKKRSLQVVNEHFEPNINVASASEVVSIHKLAFFPLDCVLRGFPAAAYVCYAS